MKLELLKSTQDIMEIAKHISGKGFKFIHKPDMQGAYGRLKAARKNMPEHLFFYKSAEKGFDWSIAHECGHIIRLFSVDEKDRKIPKSTQENRNIAIKQIANDLEFLSQFIPIDILGKEFDIWYNGTIEWLTNMTIDVRIEKWIYDNFSELRNSQKIMIDKMMEESSAVLIPDYRYITPKKIFQAMICLNYSFAICMDHVLGENYSTPYDLAVLVEYGEDVIKLTDLVLQEDKGYKQDIEIIDECAKILGIRDWYEWTDFENIPLDYVSQGV